MANFSRQRLLVRHWNAGVARIPGWPKFKLTEPAYAKRFTGPALEDFPQGLMGRHRCLLRAHRQTPQDCQRQNLPAVQAVHHRHAPAGAYRRRQSRCRRRHSARGAEIARAIFSAPDRVEIIIEHYWEKNGQKPTLYTIDLASKLLALARSEALSEADIARLDEIRIALEQYRSTGLTEKNRTLIRQIAQSDVWREVVRLPQKLMAEATANRKTKPIRAAVTAQLAIAILILIRAPIRMQNLASIRIGLNLVRPGGPGAPYMLVFPDYDVKNGVPLEFEFDEDTTAIIDEYIHQHRPQLMRGFNHDYLFPGGGSRDRNSPRPFPSRSRTGSGRSSD